MKATIKKGSRMSEKDDKENLGTALSNNMSWTLAQSEMGNVSETYNVSEHMLFNGCLPFECLNTSLTKLFLFGAFKLFTVLCC